MSDFEEDIIYSQDDFAAIDAFEARLRSPGPTTTPSYTPQASTSTAKTESSADVLTQTQALEFDVNDIDWSVESLDNQALSDESEESMSLFRRFRPWNSLAVTDLSAPGFCEVKHRYNLFGRRHLAPEQRPSVVRRKDGKQILVDRTLQATADRVMDAGKAIHKKLELEVHPEQRLVITDTRADRVALRLLNILINLSVLKYTGISREIPIHGFLNGFYVSGIIDEVQKRALPKQDAAKTKGKAPVQENLNASKLDSYFKISPAKRKDPKPTHQLVLTDHKTRSSPKMPHSTWTKSNRIQLMIYKAMWDSLAKQTFDWAIFYQHHRVEPTAELSEGFRKEMRPLLLAPDLAQAAKYTTLGQIVQAVQQAFQEAGSLSSAMEIVYRLRPVRAAKSESEEQDGKELSKEEQDLQIAIAASLQADGSKTEEGYVSSDLADVSFANQHAPQQRKSKRIRRREPVSSPVGALKHRRRSAEDSTLPQQDPALQTERPENDGVIGIERFDFFQSELDAWLLRMGSYWRSEREPEGVAAQDVSFKCRSCEYSNNCEWLEAKAAQAAADSRARRLQRESSQRRSASVRLEEDEEEVEERHV